MSHQRADALLTEQHAYHVSPRVRIGALARYGILFIMPCIFLIVVLLYQDLVTKLMSIPICLLLVAIMVWAYRWRTHVSLITSPEGISYTSIAYHISTPWNNVAGIGGRTENTQEQTYVQGLTLYQLAPIFQVRTRARFLLPPRAEHFIPIDNVVNPWRNTPLEEDIRRYAPHALQERGDK